VSADTRFVAAVFAVQPDRGDVSTCGEDKTIGVKHFKSKGAAVRWVQAELTRPIPEGALTIWGFCYQQEYDEQYCWLTIEESDTIGIGDMKPPAWFKR